MKEKLQKIIDNHCKQFCELSEDQHPKEMWEEIIKDNYGCYFLYIRQVESEVEVASRLGSSSKKYVFLNDPTYPPSGGVAYSPLFDLRTLLVPNDLSLKILSLGYLP